MKVDIEEEKSVLMVGVDGVSRRGSGRGGCLVISETEGSLRMLNG